MIDIILKRQLELQRESFGVDPSSLRLEDRDHYVQAMATALIVEVGETLQEISWKPWASGQWFHRQAYLVELIDVLHFWCNLVLVATDDPQDVLDVYLRKAEINALRQKGGYTGLDKCPTCHRDYDS